MDEESGVVRAPAEAVEKGQGDGAADGAEYGEEGELGGGEDRNNFV